VSLKAPRGSTEAQDMQAVSLWAPPTPSPHKAAVHLTALRFVGR
jgi:hypothetical protein